MYLEAKKRRSKREGGKGAIHRPLYKKKQNRTETHSGQQEEEEPGVYAVCVCVCENTLYESLKKGQQDLVSRDAFCSPNKKVISSDIHSSIHSRCNDSTIHYYKNMLDFFLPRLNRFFFPFSSWL